MIRTPWWFALLFGVVCIVLAWLADGWPSLFGAAVAGIFFAISHAKFRRDRQGDQR